MPTEAILSSADGYTFFIYNNNVIRFKTSARLERYTKVIKWNKGYIEVMAQYKTLGEVEEYIDLNPILENLYMKSQEFLEPIKEVKLSYDKY